MKASTIANLVEQARTDPDALLVLDDALQEELGVGVAGVAKTVWGRAFGVMAEMERE